jgi:hypothetical protein
MTSLYDSLTTALEGLAAPAAQQEWKLVREKVGPDELALELDAYAGPAISLLEEGELSGEAYDAITALDRHLETFSGAHNAEEWTISALHSSTNWTIARDLASRALALMKRE